MPISGSMGRWLGNRAGAPALAYRVPLGRIDHSFKLQIPCSEPSISQPILDHHPVTMDRLAIRSVLRTSGLLRPTAAGQLALRRIQNNARCISMQPRVAEVSFWKSMIPKPLRSENRVKDPNAPKKVKSKDWNPATFFIIIFLLIGSMSIQMISLRKNFEAIMRRSDVRIALLREVVEKIQNGETVDVERLLGSGDPDKEAGWEDGKSIGCGWVWVLDILALTGACSLERDRERHSVAKPKEAGQAEGFGSTCAKHQDCDSGRN